MAVTGNTFPGGENSQCKVPGVGKHSPAAKGTKKRVWEVRPMTNGLDGAVSWGPCEERVPLAVDEEQTIGGRRLSAEPSKKAAAIVQAGDDGAGPRAQSGEVRNDPILDSLKVECTDWLRGCVWV